ncbi:MAG: gfo/Idh/MocA family oxidoreductase [Candidatus Omnitrophota bacterium]|jgi:predicted dehydrogenase|nr:MAG: gfo/Idh/MocA family oxidoreductase [Candidatus Omnitrophota bacterium]
MMNTNRKTSRRNFLRCSGLALSGILAAPSFIPASALGKGGHSAPNDRIVMGFIGMGTMGNGHLFGGAWTYLPGGYISRDDVQVAAVSDVWRDKRETARNKVNEIYAQKLGKSDYDACKAFADFRDLLAMDEVDAVLIATPIHWHAVMAYMAAKAGKDIYCEKPTAVSIHESKAVRKAVKENKRIYQAGTQQRSEYEGKFRTACELVRNGRVGELKTVYAFCDGGGANWLEVTGDETPTPEGFDWDLWLGPAPKIPFQGRADAHLFGFGGINWGQHHYDIVQWGLDADRTGPVELDMEEGRAVYRYTNGVTVYGRPYPDEKIGETGGGWFVGTEGRIGVDREHLVSHPAGIVERPIGANDIHLYHSDSHSGNFIDCIRSRKPTICDAETAHRSASVLLLGGIVQKLNRKLKWDPVKEEFINDEEANQLLSLTMRPPWNI